MTWYQAIRYSTNLGGAEDGQEDGALGDEDLSSHDDDFVGSGAESEGESADEAPGIVTPPGELADDSDRRGKKTKGKASQGTTSANKFPKLPKQTPNPKKAATPNPKTPSHKKAAAAKTPLPRKTATSAVKKSVTVPKTPTPKKSDTPKQPSTGKYAGLKRAVKPKSVAEDKRVRNVVTDATSIDTSKPQTPSRPTAAERMAISQSANIDAPTAHAPQDATLPQMSHPQSENGQQHQATESRPAGLPMRPYPLHILPPAPKFETPGMVFPPAPLASINPAWISQQESTTSLPPGPASLPPKPPFAPPPLPSRYISQPAVQPQPMPNSMLGNMTSYLPFNSPSSQLRNAPNYLSDNMHNFPGNDSSFLHTTDSTRTTSLLPSTTYHHFDPSQAPSQAARQPSGSLSAMPGTGLAITLPTMEPNQVREAHPQNPPSTTAQPLSRPWELSTWDPSHQGWDLLFDQ